MSKKVLHTEDSYHERLVPDAIPWYNRQIYYDHIDRYVFAKRFVKNKIVLDIACGSGYGSLLMVKNGAQVIAIDNEKEALEYARSRYPNPHIKYFLGNAEKIPLKDKSIDGLVSFETLEHVHNYKKFLSEIKRVVRKNGTIIISTPNKELGTEEANPFHIKEFTLKEFQVLMKENFTNVKFFGQKPVHRRYIRLVTSLTSKLPPGKLRWLVDTGCKIVFRGSKVQPLSSFTWGFTPTYLLCVGKNE